MQNIFIFVGLGLGAVFIGSAFGLARWLHHRRYRRPTHIIDDTAGFTTSKT